MTAAFRTASDMLRIQELEEALAVSRREEVFAADRVAQLEAEKGFLAEQIQRLHRELARARRKEFYGDSLPLEME